MKRQFIRFISLFLAAIVLFGDSAVLANAASTISLPSPSGYFGTASKTEKDGNVTVYTYPNYKSFPAATVDKYVQDMESKGLKMTREGTMVDGDKLRRMEWKNDSAVILWWRKASESIEIRVHPCVNLTESTASVENTNSGKTMLPMPRDYFDNKKKTYLDDSTNSLCYVYSYTSYPTAAADKYAAALEKLGFDASYDIARLDGHYRSVNYGNTLCIVFKYSANTDELTIILYKNGLKKAGYISESDQEDKAEETKPTPTEPQPTSPSGATGNSGCIPDPGAFLGCVTLDNRPSGEDAWQYSYSIKADDAGKKGVREFVELIQDPEYKLELIDYQVIDYTAIERGYYYRFSFKYTGPEKFSTFKDYNNQNSHVMVQVSHIKDVWGIGLSLYMAKDLKDELMDTGKRASERVTCLVSGGNTYDVDDDDSDDKHTVPCGACNNTGECQNCGGDGYLESSASDKEDRNCTSCHPSRGKCSSCKGDGWLN